MSKKPSATNSLIDNCNKTKIILIFVWNKNHKKRSKKLISTKQRAYLRAMAVTEEPVLQIGKEGITEGTRKQAEALFEARELFKIKVLKNCDITVKQIAEEFSRLFNCEVVQVIGSKISVYRRSKRKDVKHIELP